MKNERLIDLYKEDKDNAIDLIEFKEKCKDVYTKHYIENMLLKDHICPECGEKMVWYEKDQELHKGYYICENCVDENDL